MLLTTYAFDYQWPTEVDMDDEVCVPRIAGKRIYARKGPKKTEPVRKRGDSSQVRLLDRKKVNAILCNIEWTTTSLMGKLVEPKLIPATLTEEQQRLLDNLAQDAEFNYVPNVKKALCTEAEENDGLLAQMQRMGNLQRVRIGPAEKITVMNKSALAALMEAKSAKEANQGTKAGPTSQKKPEDATKKAVKVPPKPPTSESTPDKGGPKFASYNFYKEGPHHNTWQDFKCFCFPASPPT